MPIVIFFFINCLFFSEFPIHLSHSSGDQETFGLHQNTFWAALKTGIARHAILLTALLDVSNSFGGTVDDLPHIFHTEVHLVDDVTPADTSAQETGTGISTLGVAGWHLWHARHVSLLTGRPLVSLHTLASAQQTREVGCNIALGRNVSQLVRFRWRDLTFTGLLGLFPPPLPFGLPPPLPFGLLGLFGLFGLFGLLGLLGLLGFSGFSGLLGLLPPFPPPFG